MTEQPHRTPEFCNSAEYTVTITFRVAGGERPRTADRRAEKIAERLASAAARAAGVVEVTAKAGHSTGGEMSWPHPVRFDAANSGSAAHAERDLLARYLDPDHERALRSLAAENAAFEARRRAEQDRRQAVGCANAHKSLFEPSRRECLCVYCQPGEHDAVGLAEGAVRDPFRAYRCLCGVPVPMPGQRCLAHRDVSLVVLDGDSEALQQLDSDDGLER